MPLHHKQRETEIARRAQEIVDQMTVEECVWQTLYTAPAIERLGIPSYNWWNEALHGVAGQDWPRCFRRQSGWRPALTMN